MFLKQSTSTDIFHNNFICDIRRYPHRYTKQALTVALPEFFHHPLAQYNMYSLIQNRLTRNPSKNMQINSNAKRTTRSPWRSQNSLTLPSRIVSCAHTSCLAHAEQHIRLHNHREINELMNVTTSRTTRSPYRSQKSFIAPLASGKTHTQHAHHIPRSRSPFKPFCRTAPTRRTT